MDGWMDEFFTHKRNRDHHRLWKVYSPGDSGRQTESSEKCQSRGRRDIRCSEEP